MVDPISYIRKLTAFLVISGSLNIILIVIMFYWGLSERPPSPYFELKPADEKSLAADYSDSEVIRYFRRMPLQWLISRLNNTQIVENGYTQRDLALASLVSFHYFDIDRAFTGLHSPSQKRLIVYGKFSDGRSAELIVYPGLSDKHFDALRHFAATERWPLTSRGLFLALQKEEKEEYDPDLLDAFFMTSEFSTIEMLFSRNDAQIKRDELLKVLLEGNWELLTSFVEQQKISHDLSQARRQNFLLEYARNKSKAAAQLILKTDGAFAARKLDDSQVLMLLTLAEGKNPYAEQFALTLLTNPRSDEVWKLAAARLYEYNDGVIPDSYQHQTALARFASNKEKEIGEKEKAPSVAIVEVSKKELIPKTKTPKGLKTESQPVALIASPKESKPLPKQPLAKQPLAKQPIIAKPSSNSKIASTPSVKTLPKVQEKKDVYYIVQEGDSLWKIGRRFSVDIEVIRAFNQLESDTLRPGKTLKIPGANNK